MSQEIRALDDLCIARIAAGEVIERPASVVKELIENSLDAGAREIAVEIREGGRRWIQVRDDGHGIPADQLELAFQKHATSKLRRAEDLESVATLGFRGEALASIASVSHLQCLTRAAGEERASRLRIDNGRQLELGPAGAPPGTTITVENLFNAVPARLAFLKHERTEAGHILELVARYALAHPQRRFSLRRDDREVFRSPGSGAMEDALAAVFGRELAAGLLPVAGFRPADESTAEIRVSGFVSPPHVHRSNRKQVTLLVNGRWVQDSQLAFAVAQAYHGLLPKGRHPVGLLLIELPPRALDVNVHPAKTEVRFRDGRAVFATLQRAVRAAVVEQAGVAPADSIAAGDLRPSAWRRSASAPPRFDPGGRSGGARGEARDFEATGSGRLPGYERSEDKRLGAEGRIGEQEPLPYVNREDPAALARQPKLLESGGQRLPMLRLIGQLAQMYLLAEGPDGLYLIDQHAAHERVMYERFMARPADLPVQALLAAETVTLPPRQLGMIEEQAALFRSLGFEIEPFGEDTALVRGLPESLAGSASVAEIVRNILDAAEEGGKPIQAAFEDRLVRAVCKRATVKAGQSLSPEEMRGLLRDLEDCESPWTCPHGRPTVVRIEAGRLERLFGRT